MKLTALPLNPEFYERSTEKVARDLLGKIIFHKYNGKKYLARITETEAYLGTQDRACHTFGGRKTERVKSMYLKGGYAYIYFIYGMYFCLNVVTRDETCPEAVLIRAAEPIQGFKDLEDPRLLAGPGKLCREMKITKAEDGLNLSSKKSSLLILDDGYKLKKSEIIAKPRVGVDYAEEAKNWPLRFYISGHKSISRT